MYYYVFPSISNGNYCNWLLSNTQIVQTIQITDQIENQNKNKKSFSPNILLPPLTQQHAKLSSFSLEDKINKVEPQEGKVCKDDNYKPKIISTKKQKKSQQLQNRNVVPNIIRLILSFVQKKAKSWNFIERLFKRYVVQSTWSVKRFYLYQNLVKGKMNNYVNEDTLDELCVTHPQQYDVYPEIQQRFYNKITRILIDWFLRKEISVCILTSRRMDNAKKYDHLRVLRSIRAKKNQTAKQLNILF